MKRILQTAGCIVGVIMFCLTLSLSYAQEGPPPMPDKKIIHVTVIGEGMKPRPLSDVRVKVLDESMQYSQMTNRDGKALFALDTTAASVIVIAEPKGIPPQDQTVALSEPVNNVLFSFMPPPPPEKQE